MNLALKILAEETPKEFFKRRNIQGFSLPPGYTLEPEEGSPDHYSLWVGGIDQEVGEVATGSFVNAPGEKAWLWYCYDKDMGILANGYCDTKNEAISALIAAHQRAMD